MNTEKIIDQISTLIFKYGPSFIGAIAVWFIGSWIIKMMVKAAAKMMEKSKMDSSLQPFLMSLISIMLRIMLVISVLSMLGIEMTSFIAILGAAGLAVGMALSGTLQNFAGGVIILLFKPYKVGDFIEAQGYTGTVSAIQIFNTILKTPDNKTVIIPNGGLATSSLTNYTAEETRRVDWKVGIAYGDDADKAKAVMLRLCEADERILKDPAIFVAVSELGDSSVNFALRAWVNVPDYWNVYFDMNEKIYKTFAQEGLNIPFPQMDVHVHQNK